MSNDTFCVTDQQRTGSGKLSVSDPIFMLTQLGRNRCTNRQTLVSLAAAKSLTWCMQHALADVVFSCDVAVPARYTFTHAYVTYTYTRTARMPQSVLLPSSPTPRGPFPLLLAAAGCASVCLLSLDFSMESKLLPLVVQIVRVCVYEFVVCVPSAFFPC